MTAAFAIRTFIEIFAASLLILGFVYERKIIAFENKLAHAIAVNIRNHRRRKLAAQRQAMAQAERHVPAADVVYTPVKPQEPAKRLPGKVA